MEIHVDYIDTGGIHSELTYHLPYLGFIKHLACAGQRYMPTPQKLMRSLGMFLHYSLYLDRRSFNVNRFSEPPPLLSDPTEKAQFSNLAGKAIADFLSKRISGSLFTVSYEAAMRVEGLRVIGARPDLIAYSSSAVFAIEAKGRSRSDPGDMTEHKTQANSGPLPVNFSVASIAYDIYREVKCNYHDPFKENISYPSDSLTKTSRQYYTGLADFLNQSVFESDIVSIQDEDFYEIRPNPAWWDKYYIGPHFLWWDLMHFYAPSLLLPANIRELASDGLSNKTIPFQFKQENDNERYLYIDTDRVGLRIRRY
jgi:hypothetical protein